MDNICILLAFLLVTISLLIPISIYYYCIEHRSKEKHILPYYHNNNKSKEIDVHDIKYK